MAGSLLKSTGVVGTMTFVSRVLGLIRDQLQARLFGADAAMDVFFVAFRIPNLFRRLFAEGAFTQAFVPVLSEVRNTRSEEEVKHLVDVVAGTMAGLLGLMTAAAILISPLIMYLFAPGFAGNPEKFRLGVELLRWTFPYLPLISLTAFIAGILNTYGRFAQAAFNPTWMNVCLILAAWYFAPSVEALAIGVCISGIVQLAFLLPSVAKLGLLPRPRWGWHDPQVRRIIGLMMPIAFGSSASQLSLLLDTVIASFLKGDGNVSWLWYANRLMEFPLGTFSVAIATVILPSLSRHHARASAQDFSATLDWGIRLILVIGLPATLGLVLLGGPLVSTLFQSHAFDVRSVYMTTWSLMAYATGFLGFSLVKILVPGFYARQETRVPVRFAFISFGVGMACSLTFTGLALVTHFVAPHAAIALATSTGAWVNALMLLTRLRRDGIYRPAPGWNRFLLQLLAANAAMGVFLLLAGGTLSTWTGAAVLARVVRLGWIIGAAMVAYFAVLWILGLRLKDFRQSGH